jgi:nucleotide-binding universal stress UspA family protein
MRTFVTVGVDGSSSATRAADYAAALAGRHGLSLDVVHVFSWPALYPPLLPESVAVRVNPREVAGQLVRSAADDVRKRFPGLTVKARLVDGDAAGTLVDASRTAAYLVVGHRGVGGFSELLLGSVGVHTTTHARCPVVVFRGDPGVPGAPLVVGVDGSVPARAAARYAFEEARVRGVELIVGLASPPARSRSRTGALPPHPDGIDPIEAGLGDHVDRYPDVKMRRELRHGDSAPQVLVTLAEEARAGLLVVGSRGIGGFRGLLLGSTGRALVDHAPCPVMVIPKLIRPAINGRQS